MALRNSHSYVLACTIPAAIAVAAYIWVKRKKKRSKLNRSKDPKKSKSILLGEAQTTSSTSHTDPISTFRVDLSTTGYLPLNSSCELKSKDKDTLFASRVSNLETNLIEEKEDKTQFSPVRAINCSSSLNMASSVALSVQDCMELNSIRLTQSNADREFLSDAGAEMNSTVNSELSYFLETTCSLCDESTISGSADSTIDSNESFKNDSFSDISSMLDDSFVNYKDNFSETTENFSINNFNISASELGNDSLSVILEESEISEIDHNSSGFYYGNVAVINSSDINTTAEDFSSITNRNCHSIFTTTPGEEISALSDNPENAENCEMSKTGDMLVPCESSQYNNEKNAFCDDELSSICVKESEMKTDDRELPVATSPALSADEPELQKLTNGHEHETSAYGSSNHSPAEELLESPTDNEWIHSEDSSDSGKGGSDTITPNAENFLASMPVSDTKVYEFDIPPHLCGRMIGFKGQNVRAIKLQTRAHITIYNNPFHSHCKVCAIYGTENEIHKAIDMIRKRFPHSKYNDLCLTQVNVQGTVVTVPDTLRLQLPHGVTFDVILSSLINAGHFFLQQPTHPTYSSLSQLDHVMHCCYNEAATAPALPALNANVICAAQAMGGWYRAQIVDGSSENDECDIRFLDYGGYSRVSSATLKQIRADFMTLPFQASECYLANASPINSTWSVEATTFFEELAQGQILQAQIMGYAEDGIPYVQLYRIQGAVTTFINAELVNNGFATWVDHLT